MYDFPQKLTVFMLSFPNKYKNLICYKKDGKKNNTVFVQYYISPWNSFRKFQFGKQLAT